MSKTNTQTKKVRVIRPAPAKKKSEPAYHLKEFDKPAFIAAHFGFTAIKTPHVMPEDIKKARPLRSGSGREWGNGLYPTAEEKTALLSMYEKENMAALPHPLMLFMKRPYPGVDHKKHKDLAEYELDILGTANAVAEATALRTTLSILAEEGLADVFIDLNTVGDRDSTLRFERELQGYIRKNINAFPAELRQQVKEDIFNLVRDTDEKTRQWREGAPKSISCLSEFASQHFKETLEYLEVLGVPYKINNSLVGERGFNSHTVFEIRDTSSGTVLAVGTRHNHIGKRLGFKKDTALLSVNIAYKRALVKKPLKNLPKPRFYLVQIGFHAKLKSIPLLESLRKEHIPVFHSLSKDKLQPQLQSAENLKVPYVLIIGMKEAMENTVVVRNADNRSQETVPAAELGAHLKKLK